MKIFVYVETEELFFSKKIGFNENNTKYITGSADATPVNCVPTDLDIFWEQIVFIDENGKIWTHGKFYSKIPQSLVTSVNGQSGAITINGNVQADWNATSGDAAILNKPNIIINKSYIEIYSPKLQNSSYNSYIAFGIDNGIVFHDIFGLNDDSYIKPSGTKMPFILKNSTDLILYDTYNSGPNNTNSSYININYNNGFKYINTYLNPNINFTINNTGVYYNTKKLVNEDEIPTKTSELTNDSGFLTEVPVTSVNGATGAVTVKANVQSDWNATTGDAVILNKPTIPTVPTTSTSVTENDNNPVSGGAVYAKFEDLIGSAPAALDTLEEIASALNNDADLAGTLSNQISGKISKVSSATAGNFASLNSDGTLSDSGHKHSDYLTSETQADWNETNTSSAAYINNKPTIPKVNDSTVTLTMNGNTVGTFTLNKSGNTTIDLGNVLTSHQSIKTVNNESLVGSGNINIQGLPTVTSTDNGKVLMVVNGAWQLVSPVNLYSGSTEPDNSQGNNGDIYVQS